MFVLGTEKLSTSPSIGTTTVAWLTLQSIIGQMMLLHPDRVGVDLSAPGTVFLSGLDNKTSPFNDDPQRTRGSLKSSILSKFHAVVSTNCSVPQDRLSIALNLSSLGLAVSKQIPEDMVELSAVALSLAAGEKEALTFINTSPTMAGGKESWFMRHHAGRSTAIRKFVLGSNQAIHHIDSEKIELDLVIFRYGLATPATEGDIAFTRQIFPDTIPTTKPKIRHGYTGKYSSSHRSNEELDPPRRRFLANCARLGPQYIARLWRVLDREVIPDSYSTGTFKSFEANTSLEAKAQRLCGVLGNSELLGLQDATLFLTWLTDPRSMYYVSAFSHAVPCTAAGDGALMTSMIFRDGFSDTSIQLAIPRDLVGYHCDPPRVWVLSPVGGKAASDAAEDCQWQIIGKALLLGEPDLVTEMERDVPVGQKCVFLAKRQVVQW